MSKFSASLLTTTQVMTLISVKLLYEYELKEQHPTAKLIILKNVQYLSKLFPDSFKFQNIINTKISMVQLNSTFIKLMKIITIS